MHWHAVAVASADMAYVTDPDCPRVALQCKILLVVLDKGGRIEAVRCAVTGGAQQRVVLVRHTLQERTTKGCEHIVLAGVAVTLGAGRQGIG